MIFIIFGSNMKFSDAIKMIADIINVLWIVDLTAIYVKQKTIRININNPHSRNILIYEESI